MVQVSLLLGPCSDFPFNGFFRLLVRSGFFYISFLLGLVSGVLQFVTGSQAAVRGGILHL